MGTRQPATTPAIWRSIWRLADLWSDTPICREVADQLPRNRPTQEYSIGAGGIPALIHTLNISARNLIHPLNLASRVPFIMRSNMLPMFDAPQLEDAELTRWLHAAERIEIAHRATLAWLRSTLAGYPIVRAPQLALGSPFTTDAFDSRFVWHREDFGAELHRRSSPPHVPDLLSAAGSTRADLEAAARSLAIDLQESPAWMQFGEAFRNLDDTAMTALREARRALTEDLAEARQDEYEPALALPRAQYRTYTTAKISTTLSGPARAYADAFDRVHRLLNLTVCDVFGQLVMYGEPRQISVVNVATPEPGEPMVEFETIGNEGIFLDTGQLLWVSNKVVPDAVMVERRSMDMTLAEGHRDQFGVRALQGTAEGWPAAAAVRSTPSA